MRKPLLILFLSTSLASPAVAEDLIVTNNSNDGPGSLRAALLEAAKSDTPSSIQIETNGPIELESGLHYEGASSLSILGKGQTLSLKKDETILTVISGDMLRLSGFALSGPGGWSIEQKSDANNLVSGIELLTTAYQTTDLVADLRDISVTGVSGYGIHVSDCLDVLDCSDGSAASIEVFLKNVTIKDTGHGRYDADGVRVDERGPGDLRFTAINSQFINNGADGIEIDEGHSGNVVLKLLGSQVNQNGTYCSLDVLEPALPEPAEAEFEEGVLEKSALPDPVTGSADDACIEFEVDYYDDGSVEAYEYEIDVEDGVDVDEGGAGTFYATMIGNTISENYDEALDFDERGEGDIVGTFLDNIFVGNADDALKLSERAEGATIAFVDGGSATGNGDSGYLIEEEGPGELQTVVTNVQTSGNDDAGIEVVQEDEGIGRAMVFSADVADGIKLDGAGSR